MSSSVTHRQAEGCVQCFSLRRVLSGVATLTHRGVVLLREQKRCDKRRCLSSGRMCPIPNSSVNRPSVRT
uniref:Uncharacterized protein n=1 Tax=Anguilla anguilla TaxID=7936 RepID=A0A0E9W824_ANGAN